MRKFNIDFNKTLKPVVIAYATLFIIGIIFTVHQLQPLAS